MTVVLDTPRVFGGTAVAALVRNAIGKHRTTHHIAVTVNKSPVVVLVRVGDQVDAFTPQGDPLVLSQVHKLYPDPVAQFMHMNLS